MVLAGAGSGKTTVIINRIAQLIKYGCAYNSDFEPEITSEEAEILEWYGNGDIPEIPPEMEEYLKVNPVKPYNILARTFTNKAAAELKERLEKTLSLYLSELDNASERIKGKNTRVVYKELIR